MFRRLAGRPSALRPAPLKVYARQDFRVSGRRVAVCCVLALLLGGCSTERKALFEEEAAPEWKELPLQLPAFPVPDNLIPLQVSPDASASFFIDEKSLSLGADGIVRYSLLVKAAGGAENLSYEGDPLRHCRAAALCAGKELRVGPVPQ